MGNREDIKNRIFVVGANHRSSSMALRDRLFVEDDAAPAFLKGLRETGVEQAIVMSTCDRVEVFAMSDDPKAGVGKVVQALGAHAQMAADDLNAQMYSHFGPAAVRHVFAIAAALDSLVIGEPQVLGQIKAGHRMAQDSGMVGPALETTMQAAYGAAKRIRTETGIGEGPVSIAAAAIQLASDLHGDLSRCTGLLIGSGDMGDLVGTYLKSAGIKDLRVTHPLPSRAEGVAQELGCPTVPFEQLPELLVNTDVVLTALNRRTHAVTSDMIKAAIKARKRKPVFIIDTGIPGDVDPQVNAIEEAFLYDLNDLERVAMEGRASREGQTREAWTLLDEELASFVKGNQERAAVPAFSALRDHFEAYRIDALAQSGGDAEKATRLLANRLLHDPTKALRDMASQTGASDELAKAEALLGRLFNLGGAHKPSDGK